MKRITNYETSTDVDMSLPIAPGRSLGDYIIQCIEQGTSAEIVGDLEYDEDDSDIHDVDPNADVRTDFFDAVEQLDSIQRSEVIKNKQRQSVVSEPSQESVAEPDSEQK